MSAISRMTKLAFVALAVVTVSQIAGCWLIEYFPVPTGRVDIRAGTSGDAQTIYEGIVGHLQEMGFVDQHHKGFMIGPSSGGKSYWILFELPEPENLGFTVAIDMNPSSGEVVYQYSEHTQGSDYKEPPVFSPNACKILADINSFTAEIAIKRVGTDNVRFTGPGQCEVH